MISNYNGQRIVKDIHMNARILGMCCSPGLEVLLNEQALGSDSIVTAFLTVYYWHATVLTLPVEELVHAHKC